MDWLPKDYKEPTTSNYVKLVKGNTKLRITSEPIMGWEYWTVKEGKRRPNRVRAKEEVPSSAWMDEKNKPKFFWAMGVWNYEVEKSQVWEITQATIRQTLSSLATDENWGNPRNYDLVIEREGEKLDTTYTVKPVPPSTFEHEAELLPVNLEALFTNENPFAKTDEKVGKEIEDADVDIDEILDSVDLETIAE